MSTNSVGGKSGLVSAWCFPADVAAVVDIQNIFFFRSVVTECWIWLHGAFQKDVWLFLCYQFGFCKVVW